MWMLERGGELDLAAEAVDVYARGHLRGQDLDYNLSVERDFGRQKDAGHPATAELALKGVGVAHRGLELRTQVRRQGSVM